MVYHLGYFDVMCCEGFPINSSMMLSGLGDFNPKYMGSLDVVYHLGYFNVICCECGDNDGYKH